MRPRAHSLTLNLNLTTRSFTTTRRVYSEWPAVQLVLWGCNALAIVTRFVCNDIVRQRVDKEQLRTDCWQAAPSAAAAAKPGGQGAQRPVHLDTGLDTETH